MMADVVDFRRGPAHRPPRTRGIDWTNTPEQRLALTVPCRSCRAPAGSLCVTDTGAVLTRFPAHPKRTNDAEKNRREES